MSENENNAVFPMSLADVDKATLSPMMQQYAEMKEWTARASLITLVDKTIE